MIPSILYDNVLNIPRSSYLSLYLIQLIIGNAVYLTGSFTFIFGCLRASRKIHKDLATSVLGTTLRWLDTTPTSRVTFGDRDKLLALHIFNSSLDYYFACLLHY